MPAAIPLAVAAVGAGASIYNSKKQRDAEKKAQAAASQQTGSDRAYREQLLSQMFGGGGLGGGLSGYQSPSPSGGGGRSGGQSAEELYNRINTDISMDQWKAWEGKQDPSCPPEYPFRTDKKVHGGDQNECVETPDNCPSGTRAYGKDKCLPEGSPEFGGDDRGGPGGNYPDPRGGGPGGGGGGMYPYAGAQGPYGSPWMGGDYGLSSMYQGLLGNAAQSQSVLAPQIAALQKQKEGQVQGIMASIPPGGQRDRALRQLDETFNQSLSGLRQGLITSSMSGLQSLYGTQLDDSTKRWLGKLSSDTTRYGIDKGDALGWGQLRQSGDQFNRNFGMDQLRFLTGSDQWNQEFQRQGDWRTQDQNAARNSQLTSTIGGLLKSYLENKGSGGGTGGYSGKTMYDTGSKDFFKDIYGKQPGYSPGGYALQGMNGNWGPGR